MQVDAYEMLSPRGVQFVSHTLPFFELFLGLWIFSGIGLRFSSLSSVLVVCGFLFAIGWAYHRNLVIKCGCGIGPDEQVGPGALLRDGLLFLPLAIAVALGAFRIRPSPTGDEA